MGVLYNYKEMIELYGSDYKLKKAIAKKEVFTIEKGIYSDDKCNYSTYELILKKYDKSFLVKDSALYHLGFVKDEPDKIHVGTARNAVRIKDKRVQQHFYGNLDKKTLESRYGYEIKHILCSDNIRSYTTENQNEIRFWDLQALLFDLIRDSKNYPRQELLDLLLKFRECSVFTEFDYDDFLDNFYNENLFFDKEIHKMIEEIETYVIERKCEKKWNWDWI